ncbi:myelin-oligodendrocyte glycoprotein-like isoform X2 [Betta splendens]|uniref:Myelin-oligodendrocyte glycoprotein-like isoform X2 n=1 Tax=Betta splendens TaxID=158456 RepID=A0A6P7N7I2_BETSP|nr:myelin-oligodendrocyte glycoprotein-like isoform X2 [Betta splendens]
MNVIHFFVLIFLAEAAVAQHDAVCQTQPVKVVEGDDVTLRCRLRPSFDVTGYTVDWTRVELHQVVHLYRHRKDDTGPQMEQYRTRTELSHQNLSRGVLDLHISSLHLSDAGEYRCHVPRLSASCTQTVTVGKRDEDGTSTTKAPPIKTTEPHTPGVSAGEPVQVPVVICVSIAAAVVLTLVTCGSVRHCSRRIRRREEMLNANHEVVVLSLNP